MRLSDGAAPDPQYAQDTDKDFSAESGALDRQVASAAPPKVPDNDTSPTVLRPSDGAAPDLQYAQDTDEDFSAELDALERETVSAVSPNVHDNNASPTTLPQTEGDDYMDDLVSALGSIALPAASEGQDVDGSMLENNEGGGLDREKGLSVITASTWEMHGEEGRRSERLDGPREVETAKELPHEIATKECASSNVGVYDEAGELAGHKTQLTPRPQSSVQKRVAEGKTSDVATPTLTLTLINEGETRTRAHACDAECGGNTRSSQKAVVLPACRPRPQQSNAPGEPNMEPGSRAQTLQSAIHYVVAGPKSIAHERLVSVFAFQPGGGDVMCWDEW